MAIKIKNKKRNQFITGVGFLILGFYMMFGLNDVRGQIPFLIGLGFLWWRM